MATTTLLKNKRAFGVELESTENTAETIAAADCFRATNPSIECPKNPIENEGVRTTLGKNKPIPGGRMCNVSAGFYLKGSGTGGTAPTSAISDLLQAAGFAETDGTVVVDYDLSDTSSSVTCQIFEGAVVGGTGKSKIAKGVRGNMSGTLEPGGKAEVLFEGQGGLSSDADATVLAASGEDSTDPPALVSASMTLAEIHADAVWSDDGDPEKVDDGAGSNEELALSFTQVSTAQTLVGYLAKIQKVGTPANETNGLTIRVETDNAGDPSGSPVANTTVNMATSLIEDNHFSWYLFLLDRGSRGTLAASTDYHIVVSADYDTDSSNCVQIDTDAVAAGSQKCKYYDAAWASLALKNLCIVPLVMPVGGDDLFFGTTEWNLNNEVTMTADDPSDAQGYPAAQIVSADPTITITPRETLDTENDLAEYFDDQDELYFHCQIGSDSGNIEEIDGFRGVVVDTSEDERDGKMARSLTIRIDRELAGAGFRIRYR